MFSDRTWAAIGAVSAMAVVALCALAPSAKAGGWSGCYMGAAGVYSAGVVGDIYGADGPGIAGMLGCDGQAKRVVAGLWAEYSYDRYDWGGGPSFDLDVKGWAAGGRVGYLVVPGALAYLTAGYTSIDASGGGISTDADGWLGGGGAEFDLGSGFFLRTEYRYARLDPDITSWKANIQSGRVGLLYKFNWSPVSAFDAKPLK